MADPTKTRARLEELRAVGDRLALGDPDARKVRGLVCDLMDALLGREPNHDDVNISGARAAPLDPHRMGVVVPGSHGAPPQTRRQIGAVVADAGGTDAETIAEIERLAAAACAAPAPGAPPAAPLTLAEAIEAAKKRKEQQQASSTNNTNGGQ
jgi:hypothetical protein